MKRKKKGMLSVLLALFMVFTLIPGNIAFAGGKTKVTSVIATSDMSKAEDGVKIFNVKFTVSSGSPAYFDYLGNWYKQKPDGTWEKKKTGKFTSGKWKYQVQVRIDGYSHGGNGTTHVLSDSLTVKVDDESWTVYPPVKVEPTYSYVLVESPGIPIAENTSLPLDYNGVPAIQFSYVGKAIAAIDTSEYASGGKKPYTFSKVSGPGWLSVSNGGKISGTPTSTGLNTDLIVKLSDNNTPAKTTETTIKVRKTCMDPALRTKISSITATSDMATILKDGERVIPPTITVTSGEPAEIGSTETIRTWYKKKSDGSWEKMTTGHDSFSPGTWKYKTKICIDPKSKNVNDGTTHILAASLTVKVDGKPWKTTGALTLDDTSSECTVESGEFTVAAAPRIYTLTFFENGGAGTMANMTTEDGGNAILPACTFTPPTGHEFKCWMVYPTWKLINAGESHTFSGNTTLYAIWQRKSYTITAKSDDSAHGTVTGGGTYNYDDDVTLTATAKEGYKFVKWMDGTNELGTNSTLTFKVKKDQTVKAVFEKIKCYISFNANGGTGTMPNKEVEYGTIYTLPDCTFTAPVNKKFKAWNIDGVEKMPADTIVVKKDTAISAVWTDIITTPIKQVNTVNIVGVTEPVMGKLPVTTGVSVVPSDNIQDCQLTWVEDAAPYDTPVTGNFAAGKKYICFFKVDTKAGAEFTSNPTVTVDGLNMTQIDSSDLDTNPFNVFAIVTKDTLAAAAVYECKAQYKVTVSDGVIEKAESTFGTTKIINAKTADITTGSTVTIKADPAPSGQTFDKWVAESGTITFADENSEVTTFEMPGSEVTIKATYKAIPSSGGGSGSSSGGSRGSNYTYYTINANATFGGSISPSGNVSIRKKSDKTFYIKPNKGYMIADVLVDGKSVGAVETYTFTDVSQKHSIKAIFKKKAESEKPQKDFVLTFDDVSPTDWFYDAVMFAANEKLMNGTGERTFSPKLPTSRAMLVTILWNLDKQPQVTANSPFADVEPDSWYTTAIAWAFENGIVKGTNEDKFSPNDNLTREQLVTILFNYAKYKGYDVTLEEDTNISEYNDFKEISDYAIPAMKWAYESGLIKGYEQNLMPKKTATRAEMATILNQFCVEICK